MQTNMKGIFLVLIIETILLINNIDGTSVSVEDLQKCHKKAVITSKFYTILDRNYKTKVRVTRYKPGPSGDYQGYYEYWDGDVNIIKNTVTLDNGRIINYENNDCQREESMKTHFECNKQGEFEKIYYSGPVDELVLNENKKYIIFTKRDIQFAFELDEEYSRCGRKLYDVKHHDLLVYEHSNPKDCYEDENLWNYESSSRKLLKKLDC